MEKKSFLDKITGKKIPNTVTAKHENLESENQIAGDVDHLWMKEDIDARKPKIESNTRVDTGILRGRIADKIAKLNNN